MTAPLLVYRTPRKEPCDYKLPWRAVYTPHVAERICDEVAAGRTLERIAIEEPWAPSVRQMRYWLNEHPLFKEIYADAVHIRADKLAQEVLDVADDLTVEPDDRKLMINARQWLAGKLNPRDWGERKVIDQNVTATIQSVQHLDVSHLTLEQIHAAEAALLTVVEGVAMDDDDEEGDDE